MHLVLARWHAHSCGAEKGLHWEKEWAAAKAARYNASAAATGSSLLGLLVSHPIRCSSSSTPAAQSSPDHAVRALANGLEGEVLAGTFKQAAQNLHMQRQVLEEDEGTGGVPPGFHLSYCKAWFKLSATATGSQQFRDHGL